MIGNVHELPLFSNKGTEMTLTTIAQSQLWPIVYDQLYAYLEEHDIICKYQSGFRAIHSTVTALLEATDTWANIIVRGKNQCCRIPRYEKGFRHGGPRDPFTKTKPLRY